MGRKVGTDNRDKARIALPRDRAFHEGLGVVGGVLAREIQVGVQEKFGITLVNEPVLVGCEL